MNMKRLIGACAILIALMGAGCSKNGMRSSVVTGSVVGGGPGAPSDAAAEFKSAETIETNDEMISFEDLASSATIRVPKSWKRDHDTWTQDDTRTNYVRVAPIDGEAEMDWEQEQKLDTYDVVAADKTDGGFLLIANHPTLLTTIIRKYIPDPKEKGRYYLLDCRIDYAQKRSESLSACKAGMDSLTIIDDTP